MSGKYFSCVDGIGEMSRILLFFFVTIVPFAMKSSADIEYFSHCAKQFSISLVIDLSHFITSSLGW